MHKFEDTVYDLDIRAGGIYRNVLLFFSCYVMSDSLQPHGLLHTRLPCPSLSPTVCSNSCQVCDAI